MIIFSFLKSIVFLVTRHGLVVFGGLQGLEASLEADESLEEDDPSLLFQHYINSCPTQGSRTIRTEVKIKEKASNHDPETYEVFQSLNIYDDASAATLVACLSHSLCCMLPLSLLLLPHSLSGLIYNAQSIWHLSVTHALAPYIPGNKACVSHTCSRTC